MEQLEYTKYKVYKIQGTAQADKAGPTTILGLDPKPLLKDLRPESDLKWGVTMRGEFFGNSVSEYIQLYRRDRQGTESFKSIIKYKTTFASFIHYFI